MHPIFTSPNFISLKDSKGKDTSHSILKYADLRYTYTSTSWPTVSAVERSFIRVRKVL
ncbi:13891_t:CDS:2 [Gigaspora margarita]|uniref:13891_t:CDS:1 n=1 Tax=Gigaspora margarita TaxID=4874 RepID=A0ABM8W637_GIGMA|nr:13891_t:CDS:2 [Gigaspora margarita]